MAVLLFTNLLFYERTLLSSKTSVESAEIESSFWGGFLNTGSRQSRNSRCRQVTCQNPRLRLSFLDGHDPVPSEGESRSGARNFATPPEASFAKGGRGINDRGRGDAARWIFASGIFNKRAF